MTVGSKVKQTLSSLKSVKGTLEIYGIQSQNQEAAAVFKESGHEIEGIMNDLEKRIQELEYQEPQYKGL